MVADGVIYLYQFMHLSDVFLNSVIRLNIFPLTSRVSRASC